MSRVTWSEDSNKIFNQTQISSFIQATFTGYLAQLNPLVKLYQLICSTIHILNDNFTSMERIAANKIVLCDQWTEHPKNGNQVFLDNLVKGFPEEIFRCSYWQWGLKQDTDELSTKDVLDR